MQRAQEYNDWLLNLEVPHDEDGDRDDTWAQFMKERRARRAALDETMSAICVGVACVRLRQALRRSME